MDEGLEDRGTHAQGEQQQRHEPHAQNRHGDGVALLLPLRPGRALVARRQQVVRQRHLQRELRDAGGGDEQQRLAEAAEVKVRRERDGQLEALAWVGPNTQQNQPVSN